MKNFVSFSCFRAYLEVFEEPFLRRKIDIIQTVHHDVWTAHEVRRWSSSIFAQKSEREAAEEGYYATSVSLTSGIIPFTCSDARS